MTTLACVVYSVTLVQNSHRKTSSLGEKLTSSNESNKEPSGSGESPNAIPIEGG
jgi:hypothetical protein